MVFPINTGMVAVHGRFRSLADKPATGRVDFDLISPAVAISDPLTALPSRTTGTLSLTGEFTVSLPASDINNPSPWIYRVREQVTGSNGIPYFISLADAPATIEYADLTQIPDPSLGAVGPAGPPGPVGPDGPAGPGATAPLQLANAPGTAVVFGAKTTGDAANRTEIRADGSLNFGGGAAVPDMFMYRNPGAGLQVDGGFIVNKNIHASQASPFQYYFGNNGLGTGSDQTINNSTTLIDATQINGFYSGHWTEYSFEAMIFFNSGAGNGLKLGFIDTGGSVTDFSWYTLSTGPIPPANSLGTAQDLAGALFDCAVTLQGRFTTAGGSGNIQLQFAQVTATGADTKILARSFMRLQGIQNNI